MYLKMKKISKDKNDPMCFYVHENPIVSLLTFIIEKKNKKFKSS